MFGCQSYSFGSRSCHNGAVSQDGLGPDDNLVGPRHHGEDCGVLYDGRADLGLGEVAGHLVTRKVSSCFGYNHFKLASLGRILQESFNCSGSSDSQDDFTCMNMLYGLFTDLFTTGVNVMG